MAREDTPDLTERMSPVTDWKAKLEQLGAELRQQEEKEAREKAAVLKAFRKRLHDLEDIVKGAAEFGDAFGVDCSWEISRFDQRDPLLRFQIRRPALHYEVDYRDGVLHERLREGDGPVRTRRLTLQDLSPRRVEERLTGWVQRAAEANRRLPWKG